MHTGHYISGAGHLLLLGWLAFGDVFASDPLPFEVTDVSVISGAEYEALLASNQAPQSVTEIAQPASPEVTPDAPDVAAVADDAPTLAQPTPTQTPDVETAPDVSQIAPPPPRTEVTDQAPELPEPPADLAALAPDISDRAVPQAIDRVAPQAVAPPEPEALPDPVAQEAVSPDEVGDQQQDPAEATAPEAAATEIVTEAETPSRTMETSLRPRARPARATPPRATEPALEADEVARTPAPESPAEDAVAAALAQALATESRAPSTPTGPPLTSGEKESLRVAVSTCWNVGSLSTDALGTTVVVTVSMTQDGKPINGSIQMTSSSGGSDTAARQAFEAARRAIIRCGARGFDLPVEKYGQWQEIEMTFNPERMRVK